MNSLWNVLLIFNDIIFVVWVVDRLFIFPAVIKEKRRVIWYRIKADLLAKGVSVHVLGEEPDWDIEDDEASKTNH